jgi:vancomycin resistance protein YoaR
MTELPNTAGDAPAAGSTSDGETSAVDVEPVVPFATGVNDGPPQGRPRRRRALAVRFGVAFLLGVVLAMGIGAGALYAWGQQYEGRILPGVRVGSTDLGGLTREQAEAAIAAAYASLGDGQVTLTGPDGHTTTISYAELGRGPNTQALLDAAFAAGRQGGLLATLIGAPETAIHGVTLTSGVSYDRDRLVATVDALDATIDRAPVDATVSNAQDGTFPITPSTDGRRVDEAALLAALDQQLSAFDTPSAITIDMPMLVLPPAITTAAVEAARDAAVRMAADVVVAQGDDSWTIAGTKLVPLISFSTAADGSVTPVIDETGLDPLMKSLAKDVNREPRDAGLKLVKGSVVATGHSRDGRVLRAAGMKAAIVSELGNRQAGAAALPVEAVVKVKEPKLTTADAKRFAPRMKMISDYSIYYYVIVNNHWGGNIEGPATVLHNTVVPAGAKFDFWDEVGNLRDAPGVGPGNAIENGRITVTGAFGGGICTTSTTLFNAAFRAGMIPLQRQNHSEYISRYPAGLDATVWIVGKTKQTMSFRNTTDYPILITRTVTGNSSKRWLTFQIWSVPNHRKATVTNTVIRPGEQAVHRTIEDPTKPRGYRFFNNEAVDGAKVWTTVTIYERGEVIFKKRYFSNYPAMDGVTIVGTG